MTVLLRLATIKPADHPDRILSRIRRRYHRLPATDRPGPQPQNLAGLLTSDELVALSCAGRWPLSRRDLRRLLRKPTARPTNVYRVLVARLIVEAE
jgi:hypothetical protein